VIVEQDLVYVHDETESLPDGWKVATLEGLISDSGLFCDGDWVESKDQDPNGDVRLIQLADIGVAAYRDRSDRYLTSERAAALSCTFLQRGDILVARMPDPLGRACLFPGDKKRAVTVVDVAVIRPNNPEVDCKWLMHRINSMAFRNAVASLQSGSTRLRISRRNLSRIAFPLPPLAVQLTVVDELEKQFSRLDEAVVNLQRVNANLKRYKASVLKAAVEGRLVESEANLARREGRTYETGEQLLQRILEARRAKWNGKGKYKEPEPPVLDGLNILPDGWAYATAEQMCEQIASGSTPPPEAMFSGDGDVPFLKVYNLTFDGSLDFTVKPTYVADATHQGLLARSRSIPGDVLMNIVGPPLGKVSIVPSIFPEWNINQAIVTFRTSPGLVNRLLAHWLFAQPVLSRLERTAKATAGQHNLQVSTCRKLPIPVPPLAEQVRIVAEVDRHLSIIREVEAEVDANLQRAQALRQATLAKAFGVPRTTE
jgi:type I restriction enzyme S subunit